MRLNAFCLGFTITHDFKDLIQNPSNLEVITRLEGFVFSFTISSRLLMILEALFQNPRNLEVIMRLKCFWLSFAILHDFKVLLLNPSNLEVIMRLKCFLFWLHDFLTITHDFRGLDSKSPQSRSNHEAEMLLGKRLDVTTSRHYSNRQEVQHHGRTYQTGNRLL